MTVDRKHRENESQLMNFVALKSTTIVDRKIVLCFKCKYRFKRRQRFDLDFFPFSSFSHLDSIRVTGKLTVQKEI